MFKKLLAFVLHKINEIATVPEFQEDNIHVSWADFVEPKKPDIILYSLGDKCNHCKEIELYFINNWIPYTKVNCSLILPQRIPKFKTLISLLGYKCKNKGLTKTVFLNKNFPQLDLVNADGTWNRSIANCKIMRNVTEDFLLANSKFYPGFEQGVYGDKSSAEQVASQMSQMMNQKKGK